MTNFNKFTRPLALIALLSVTSQKSFAQEDAAAIVQGGVQDANSLMQGYMGPVLKAFGAGLNSGWFQTAKPHGVGGFDITVSANVAFAPTSDLTYSLNGLNNVRPKAGEPNESPSFFGDANQGTEVELHDNSPFTGADTTFKTINLPQGSGTSFAPIPTAQLTVGVGFGTDISVRFLPSYTVNDVKVGMFGFAVKHDIKQWIPAIKELPFDMSVMFGYTTMAADMKFINDKAITPDPYDTLSYNPNPNKAYTNQKAEFESKAWTTNIVISKKMGPFTPYIGLGYQNAKSTMALKGDYPITTPNTKEDATNPSKPSFGYSTVVTDYKDPVKIEGNIAGFRANIGFRLKFTVLTLHADYTFGEYNVGSVGVGLNIQSIAPFKM